MSEPKTAEVKRGDLHTLMMGLIREEIQRQHPEAFTEDNDFDLVIPCGCTPQSAYVKINVSDLAEAILPHVTSRLVLDLLKRGVTEAVPDGMILAGHTDLGRATEAAGSLQAWVREAKTLLDAEGEAA